MTEGSCSRCGSCCRQIVMVIKGLHPNYLKYLRAHGFKEDQGFVLIPHDCQHLKKDKPITLSSDGKVFAEVIDSDERYFCDIHDSPEFPRLCRLYHGQKQIGRFPIYRPPNCSMVIR